MSGGVDSSVVAARVARSGLRAFGVTLAMWPASREVVRDRGCCSIDAVEDARRVAHQLRLDHYVWNLEHDFEELVVREFEDGYAAGTTPNPCVRCNERVKFGLLLERAESAGATHLATGHYAKVMRRGGEVTLHRAADRRRDQSYVLHRLSRDQLRRAVFPLGTVSAKADVRAEAAALRLGTAAKPESQDLCFVQDGMRAELERRLAGRFGAGPILDRDGRELGRHAGLPFHTVGQRAGLGVQPRRPDAPPLYVLEVRRADNAVVVGERHALATTAVAAEHCSWIDGRAPADGTRCTAQLRAHGEPLAATVVKSRHGRLRVELDAPAMRPAPGQSLVLYDGDRVLGGGAVAASV